MEKRSLRKFAISTFRFVDFSIFFLTHGGWRRRRITLSRCGSGGPLLERRAFAFLYAERHTETSRWPLFHSDEPVGSYYFSDSVSTKGENQHRMRPIELITRNHPQPGRPISTSNANRGYDKTESPQIHHFDFSGF